jgi:hypothetical protein
VHILVIFLCKGFVPSIPWKSSVQRGKKWEEEGALSSLVENSGHTSKKWYWHYWWFLGGVLWFKYSCSVNCPAYDMREGQVIIGIHALVQGFT